MDGRRVDASMIRGDLAKSKKLGIENSLLTFDAFSAHSTDEVKGCVRCRK